MCLCVYLADSVGFIDAQVSIVHCPNDDCVCVCVWQWGRGYVSSLVLNNLQIHLSIFIIKDKFHSLSYCQHNSSVTV